MKKYRLFVAFLAAVSVGAAVGYGARKAEPEHWTIRNAEALLREGPGYLSEVVSRVPYADRVELLESESPWHRVEPAGDYAPGWLHGSELTRRTIVLEPPDKKTRKKVRNGVEGLAGRAFRERVEQALREDREELEEAYDWLELHAADPAFHPTAEELVRFREAGGLAPVEGGS